MENSPSIEDVVFEIERIDLALVHTNLLLEKLVDRVIMIEERLGLNYYPNSRDWMCVMHE